MSLPDRQTIARVVPAYTLPEALNIRRHLETSQSIVTRPGAATEAAEALVRAGYLTEDPDHPQRFVIAQDGRSPALLCAL